MNEKKLAKALKQAIVDDNLTYYKETLDNVDTNEITDQYWHDLVLFYRALPIENKGLIIKLIRQTSVDAVSSLLGIIDGTVDFPVELQLINQTKGTAFDDELQEEFLALTEADER
jgi:hypothetical protein